jgi:hypothetical protein
VRAEPPSTAVTLRRFQPACHRCFGGCLVLGHWSEAIWVHLYERFMTCLFEIYGFSYPMIRVE